MATTRFSFPTTTRKRERSKITLRGGNADFQRQEIRGFLQTTCTTSSRIHRLRGKRRALGKRPLGSMCARSLACLLQSRSLGSQTTLFGKSSPAASGKVFSPPRPARAESKIFFKKNQMLIYLSLLLLPGWIQEEIPVPVFLRLHIVIGLLGIIVIHPCVVAVLASRLLLKLLSTTRLLLPPFPPPLLRRC